LDIILAAMEISPKIRIQYSSKKSGIANGWKKNQGILKGLKRLDAINKKIAFEKAFSEWVDQDSKRKSMYGGILDEYRAINEKQAPYALASVFSSDAGRAAEIVGFAGRFGGLIRAIESSDEFSSDDLKAQVERMGSSINRHFKDYHMPTDQKLFACLFKAWVDQADQKFVPELLVEMNAKYQGDFSKYADDLFEESIFADEVKLRSFLDKMRVKDLKKIKNDPAYLLSQSINELGRKVISPGLNEGRARIPELQRLYMKAQMEMETDKVFYPDANFTMRVSYGQIDNFEPADGKKYKHYTTLKGIIEKDNPDIYDYRVPARLKELYERKDFGQYGFDNKMPVCFTASNHTSGGNSGSPVINGDGHLIGVNFDRNWEGTMSDTMYDPDMCRNISIDIRYALFIIDKFAGAHHLIEEMELVK